MIRHNKYHAKKCEINGLVFDSKKEGMRYLELLEMQNNGEISKLQRQVPIELLPKQKGKYQNERNVVYVADFVYVKDGEQVVEDVKSDMTRKLPDFILKRKMLLYLKGISLFQYK